jgi:hypothetical protein
LARVCFEECGGGGSIGLERENEGGLPEKVLSGLCCVKIRVSPPFFPNYYNFSKKKHKRIRAALDKGYSNC